MPLTVQVILLKVLPTKDCPPFGKVTSKGPVSATVTTMLSASTRPKLGLLSLATKTKFMLLAVHGNFSHSMALLFPAITSEYSGKLRSGTSTGALYLNNGAVVELQSGEPVVALPLPSN